MHLKIHYKSKLVDGIIRGYAFDLFVINLKSVIKAFIILASAAK